MNRSKLRIGLIFGGRSGEHQVSLMSARSVLNALDEEKYTVIQIGISPNGNWLSGNDVLGAFEKDQRDSLTAVTQLPDPGLQGLYWVREQQGKFFIEHYVDIDVYIPVLHGTFGEDGTLQGLLEMSGVAYAGAGVLGSSLGMDKGVFKDVMIANEIPVVPGEIILRRDLNENMDAAISRLERFSSYPLFTKPANMGSSVGVSKCRNRSDLYEGLLQASRYDRRILVEKGINAREIEISVLGNDAPEASVPGEVCPAADYYSYHAKYHDDQSELIIPADIPVALAELMRQVAVKAYRCIDCAGMARVDFLLDKDSGEFYLNEVNTIPGFTEISMYPKLWSASGLPYPALIDRLIQLALERKRDRDQTIWHYDA